LLVVAGVTIAVLGACSHNPHYDPSKAHHTRSGFRNPLELPAEGSFLRWQWERWWQGVPQPPPGGYSFVAQRPRFDDLTPATRRVTWLGHSTVLLQLDGQHLLTDPHLSERVSPVSFLGPRRKGPLVATPEDLPRIDVVLISHSHYDHLDAETIDRIARRGATQFVVPLGLGEWFRDRGIDRVIELDWWQQREVGGFRIHSVPVQHWSRRGLFDRNRSLWSGWIAERGGFRFFHPGDTGYSPDFKQIGARFAPVDLAALPIGAYEPSWFMRLYHIDPDEAVAVHCDVGARQSMAVHWGTFDLTDEPLDEPPRRLAEALRRRGMPGERFWVPQHGASMELAPASFAHKPGPSADTPGCATSAP
jgi:L-ascorbate metabolism protein UlaG (beta-lactamase superfamily)